METIKVKYIGVNYNTGQNKTVTIKHEIPKFEDSEPVDISHKFKDIDAELLQEAGLNIVTHTKEEKQEKFLLELDKSELMYANSFSSIADWSIIRPKTKIELFLPVELKTKEEPVNLIIATMIDINERNERDGKSPHIENLSQFALNILAVYISIKDSISGLSKMKQAEIILSSMSIGNKAAINAYQQISKIFDEANEDIKLLN